MRPNKGVPPQAGSGHSGFAPSPKGLGHSESVPNATLTCIDADIRVPTGPLQIGADWPGVFMRGDDALPWAMYLRDALRFIPDDTGVMLKITKLRVARLADILESCHARNFASGIEAPSGVETGNTGSTEGKSPAAESGDAQ